MKLMRGLTVQCHPLAAYPWPRSTCCCRKCWCYLAPGMGWRWPAPPDTSEVSLPHTFSTWWEVSCLHPGSAMAWRPAATSYMCCIQMLWSKLGSELSPNHPSFSIHRGTQLPDQLVRYCELQLCVSLGYLSFYFFIMQRKRKQSKNGKWCIHSIWVTLSWRKYFLGLGLRAEGVA